MRKGGWDANQWDITWWISHGHPSCPIWTLVCVDLVNFLQSNFFPQGIIFQQRTKLHSNSKYYFGRSPLFLSILGIKLQEDMYLRRRWKAFLPIVIPWTQEAILVHIRQQLKYFNLGSTSSRYSKIIVNLLAHVNNVKRLKICLKDMKCDWTICYSLNFLTSRVLISWDLSQHLTLTSKLCLKMSWSNSTTH